jgi:hypothetical protein
MIVDHFVAIVAYFVRCPNVVVIDEAVGGDTVQASKS